MLAQGSQLTAKVNFQMKFEGRSRAMVVKTGDKFVVTNPCYMQANGVKVGRARNAKLNMGYTLTIDQIEQLFTRIE